MFGYEYREGCEFVCLAAVVITWLLLEESSRPYLLQVGIESIAAAALVGGLIHEVGMRTFFINFIPAAVVSPLIVFAMVGIVFASEMRDMGSFVAAVSCSLAMPTIPFFTLHYILSRWVLPVRQQ
jgi:FtsH-binding integral membrane protein